MQALAGRDNRVSMTGVRLYRHGHPEQYVDHIVTVKTLLPNLFKDMDWGNLHGFLFPAKLVRATGGFEEWARHGEDWHFLCKIGLLDPEFVTDPRIGAYYRLRGGTASTNRLLMATTRARLLAELHDTLKEKGRLDWFGIDLLKMEQKIYQSLVRMQVGDAPLLDNLLKRIQELQAQEGFGAFGWRFRADGDDVRLCARGTAARLDHPDAEHPSAGGTRHRRVAAYVMTLASRLTRVA